jgi:hypothetical protein
MPQTLIIRFSPPDALRRRARTNLILSLLFFCLYGSLSIKGQAAKEESYRPIYKLFIPPSLPFGRGACLHPRLLARGLESGDSHYACISSFEPTSNDAGFRCAGRCFDDLICSGCCSGLTCS